MYLGSVGETRRKMKEFGHMETQGERGMARAAALCVNRSARARELKGEGRKIIGYLCGFVPPELITAAGMVPYRITGVMGEPLTEASRPW